MLNSETKRKIDNARDILVGKIPVPSAQIELITIALIYKFMSDIDMTNKDLGADGFFVGDFDKYSWSNIMDRKIGAHDRLYLYSEGLDKMGTNPNLPQMFRDIFRNAFLPFKDPQTLDRFLKQINDFSYDNSEDLGNAFEYLLSTAGSQGDAGQFRTPRHIIDFVVSVVEPTHTDTILDPACGTAGFLISAYKYIMNQNTDKQAGDKLTLTQKNTLTKNFVGYDISHEMVRLSLVNLFLHNFGNPHIFEYDTLTSEERRDDRFDCILANPPFMTPKGGIQPHNRFSVKASKSEVLFVDYMMEHLSPQGKAGIIIPEGIIFQSANAYKSLRKKMIEENFLYAVVSLPSGVFQPYSGVKTSILLFDKEIAKKTDDILFMKVNHDGFDLGAQRRPSDKNDLPAVLEEILEYKKAITDGTVIASETSVISSEVEKSLGFTVPKSDIIENGDYNLSMERYRTAELINSDWPMVELGEVCEILDNLRKPISKTERISGKYPYYGATGIVDHIDNYLFDEKLVLIGEDGAKRGVGDKTAFIIKGKNWVNNHAHVIRPDRAKILDELLVELINNIDLQKYITGITVPKLNQQNLKSIKIPLPPIEVQEQIVAELDGYQKIIDGAKQIVENYKPTIKIDPEWEMVELGEVLTIERGASPRPIEKFITDNKSGLNWVKIGDTKKVNKIIYNTKEKITTEGASKSRKVNIGDFILSNSMSFGRPYIMGTEGYVHDGWLILRNNEAILTKDYLYYILSSTSTYNKFVALATGGVVKNLNSSLVKSVSIPIPPLEIQQQIVAEIEKEQAMVESAKGLIEVFESKVKEKIGEVWGEE